MVNPEEVVPDEFENDGHKKDKIFDNSYDEIEIDDMDFEKEGENYYFRYPCPCGDRFKVSLKDLWEKSGSQEERDRCLAVCPSCSL